MQKACPAWRGTDFGTFMKNCSIRCGDGALANNGPEGRAHNNALKLLQPDDRQRDIIDLFHLINTAGDHALGNSPRAQTFFSLLKTLEHLATLTAAWLPSSVSCTASANRQLAARSWVI